jgi:primosomal protein N' (replication factor Y) (superfamily II helicase)
MPPPTVSVLLPLPFGTSFDYRLDPPFDRSPPALGRYVVVPFGARRLVGVVWERGTTRPVAEARLKPLIGVLDQPPLPEPLRRLVEVVGRETVTPAGAVLRLVLSTPAAFEPEPLQTVIELVDAPEKPTARQQAVLEALAASGPQAAAALARAAGVSAGVVKTMVEKGWLAARTSEPALPPPATYATPDAGRLTPAQVAAASALVDALATDGKGEVLLEGQPGAGKTEIYIEAIAATLAAGRSVLVLLPEIALSAQWLKRFEARFAAAPAVWHSGLTSAQRRRTWKLAAAGRLPVVVGARSALFLPMPELGLIVIDEEHDTSFKQEDGVIYDARTVARLRAGLQGAGLVTCSATPSLETLGLARHHVEVAGSFAAATKPTIQLVDLRRDKPARSTFLGPTLRAGLAETLARGEQAMLFLNRRGYAPLTICRACGFRFRCPNCAAWLVSHRFGDRLTCHHCGYSQPRPPHCPECGAIDSLAVAGPGVERVQEEVRALFPDARTVLMTSDTVTSSTTAQALVDAMLERRIDILIGTQLIAKGHHFPDLTLAGVVDADFGLAGGDPRAAERTFQLLYQLAGRAGREAKPGRVLIQTHLPDHPVMQALARGDRAAFMAAEADDRRESAMPPYGRLAALILSGPDSATVKVESRKLVRAAPDHAGWHILGPAPAPLALLRGRYRERILIKAPADPLMPDKIAAWIGQVRLPNAVRLQVDIDPQSFF